MPSGPPNTPSDFNITAPLYSRTHLPVGDLKYHQLKSLHKNTSHNYGLTDINHMESKFTICHINLTYFSGDIGCLLQLWKIWEVMSQSLKGLTKFLVPADYLTLTKISFAKWFSKPLCRKNFYLEIHENYWLKYVQI
ncbi:hypothetical protein VP01_76g16 [Puccinia sorghi]|uniref:Uncharacterized protein n=1 Tax=Puccinia sorghi TaxID=27349 RepID=A0A0L6UBK1_9BASI|nr:hypothetical protein VP01_76g16 [Puccinia sorghi]